jgi:hypothetical protein
MRTINATFCGCVNTPYKITNFLHLHVIILTQPELIWGRRVDKGLTELPSDRNAGIGLDVLIKYLRRGRVLRVDGGSVRVLRKNPPPPGANRASARRDPRRGGVTSVGGRREL